MLGNDYADQTCSIARSLEVVGERWTILILRDLFLGVDRFDALVASLGVTRTVLARRLAHLVDEGVVEKRRYSERPERFSYHPTAKGRELMGVIALLMQWGDRHYPHPAGPPRLLLHRGCGGGADDHLTCDRCGTRLQPEDIDAPLNPALAAG
ncbi:MAG: helix-turn-helix domain-containing protein [Pseudonocardiales bacterium]|nr:helix-turn-helix domain-containing protein [Pseudonocardiales bacterium]